MINLNYLIDHTLYQTFQIVSSIPSKTIKTVTVNPPIRIYVKKIENRITSKIKTGYNLQIVTPKTMKLLWHTKNKITKNEYGKNVPHLESIKVVLVHSHIFNNDFEPNSRVLHTSVANKSFSQLLHILPKSFIYLKTFSPAFIFIYCSVNY